MLHRFSLNRSCTYVVPFLLLLSGTSIFAQVAGSLTGRVVDPSGAAVPGASVDVLLPGGKTPLLSGKTNEAGLFAFIAVNPDKYEVAVEAKGFSKTVLGNVQVDPIKETSLGAIKLEVQSAAQVVEVSSQTAG